MIASFLEGGGEPVLAGPDDNPTGSPQRVRRMIKRIMRE